MVYGKSTRPPASRPSAPPSTGSWTPKGSETKSGGTKTS